MPAEQGETRPEGRLARVRTRTAERLRPRGADNEAGTGVPVADRAAPTSPVPATGATRPASAAGGRPGPAVGLDDLDRPAVPWLLRAAAGWSWRIIAVAAAVYLLLLLVIQLRIIALAMVAALLTTALVHPFFRLLHRLGLGRGAAAGVTVLTLVLGFAAVIAFLSATTIAQLPELRETIGTGLTQIRDWLSDGPLGLDAQRLEELGNQANEQFQQNRERLTTGAISGATILLEVLGGALLGLFAAFFFLYDGPHIWGWFTRMFSRSVRDRVDGAGAVAWQTLTGYIRGTVFVATVDAVFIGLGLVLVGVPLVAPLAVLTFLGAFIPIAGATLAGIAAVLVALVTKGVVAALIIAGVVLLVQQVEGHVLQPLVLGKSTRLHPLAVVLTITAGATLAGVAGAVVAVPLVAVLNRVGVYLNQAGRTGDDTAPQDEDADAGHLADDAADNDDTVAPTPPPARSGAE
jgi:predicted PurR-regulated permease PerM